MKTFIPKRPYSTLLIFFISTGVLLAGFYWNAWGAVASADLMESWLKTTEAIAVGRLAYSRQAGVWASAGLLGEYQESPTSTPQSDVQYQQLYNGGSGLVYEPYKSQIGFQVLLLGLVDGALHLPGQQSLSVLRLISSALSAAGLAAVVVWFYLEFGVVSAVLVLGAIAGSQWTTLFGQGVFWMLWAFYMPMLLLALTLYREKPERLLSGWLIFGIAFMGLVIKCLFNGYEFISTALVMTVVPLVYYTLKDRWPMRKTVMRLGAASAGAIAGVLVTFAILIVQISQLTGSLGAGVAYIQYSFVKRTSGIPGFEEAHMAGLQFNLPSILWQYLIGVAMDWKGIPAIRFIYLIGLFLLVTALFIGLYRRGLLGERERRKTLALVGATWFSVLAPLSWFSLFLQHAYIHVFMDYVTWYMPFVLFGAALCGAVGREVWGVWRGGIIAARASSRIRGGIE